MSRNRSHNEFIKCQSDIGNGKLLSKSCKIARAHASSLDSLEVILNVPKWIIENPYFDTFKQISKSYFFPYTSKAYSALLSQKGSIQFKIKSHNGGKTFSIHTLTQSGWKEFKDLRSGHLIQGLIPYNIKESPMQNIINKIFSYAAPSICTIENEKVETFDGLKYEFMLNDCEHIIFKDCSPSNIVEVSVKRTPQGNKVKIILDNNRYDFELKNHSRLAREVLQLLK